MAAGIGVVGTGNIAPRYLAPIAAAHGLTLIGVAGSTSTRTRAVADSVGVPALTVAELVAQPDVAIVVNLSSPRDHAAITRAAIEAGKHVYSEKPLAVTVVEAEGLRLAAAARGVTLACAPATPLGPAQQGARRLIAAGTIGAIVGATATMIYPGPDLFHAHPHSLFAHGGGPLYDMAVYDIAALHQLLGPVARVVAVGRQMASTRSIKVGPAAGATVAVEVPTHIAAVLHFASGAIATLTTSFDAFGAGPPGMTLHGVDGALRLPGAGLFDGRTTLSTAIGVWTDVAPDPAWSEDLWIIGLLDMIDAIDRNEAPRCASDAAIHVLATCAAIEASMDTGAFVAVGHACPPAPPLPTDAYARLRARYFPGYTA